MEQKQEQKNNFSVPIAIVVAGIIIAGAVYLSDKTPKTPVDDPGVAAEEVSLAPVTAEDHIIGNPNAPIVIVEYSDTECPYCKTFHTTMNKVMDEYGKDGKVAWVYRHFPLDSIHPKADKEAEATECAAELGDNDAFWKYIDRIFEITPSNNGFDMSALPEIAVEIGLDKTAFETCLNSGKYKDKVEAQFQSGVSIGIRGTPHSFIITASDGKKYPLEGAQPYTVVKQIIDAGLAQQGR